MRIREAANHPVDRAFGVVGECLTLLRESPLDDFRAIAIEVEGYSILIKDAMREMETSLESECIQELEESTSQLEEEGEETIWDLDDQDDLSLTEKQKEVLPPCINLIKAAGGVLLQVNKSLRRDAAPEGNLK